ncbi:Hypothetical protein, putative [Bodo saltans]|uniref:Uncharacterized protein n=1 Tax=Bodo saltans TaxID=75058 RepID=A0A0S4IVN9_BODSA|nr:Hypothetical protein, putative [Bodo saltans]|eukprot:CUG01517.1 Hypothetical protein, putative [Bodo saltans]
MRSHSEVTGHNDANTMKDQLRMVGNRIFNDFELTGALKTRGRIKKRRNPPLVQRLVVTPSTEQVSSLDEAFDSFVQF